MKKVIRKWFWAWQFEEEEKWLNQMAAEGWALCEVGYAKYTFTPCEKGQYTFKLEYLANHASHSESVKYISKIKESGAEYIGNMLQWVYFRQDITKGNFEALSSRGTRIKHMERIVGMLSGFSTANAIIGISCLVMFLSTHRPIALIGLANIMIAGILHKYYKKINGQCQRLIQKKAIFEE